MTSELYWIECFFFPPFNDFHNTIWIKHGYLAHVHYASLYLAVQLKSNDMKQYPEPHSILKVWQYVNKVINSWSHVKYLISHLIPDTSRYKYVQILSGKLCKRRFKSIKLHALLCFLFIRSGVLITGPLNIYLHRVIWFI